MTLNLSGREAGINLCHNEKHTVNKLGYYKIRKVLIFTPPEHGVHAIRKTT